MGELRSVVAQGYRSFRDRPRRCRELPNVVDVSIHVSRSRWRYRTARPIRTNAGPRPKSLRFASVDFDDRRYSAASVGVRYVSFVMVFSQLKSPRSGAGGRIESKMRDAAEIKKRPTAGAGALSQGIGRLLTEVGPYLIPISSSSGLVCSTICNSQQIRKLHARRLRLHSSFTAVDLHRSSSGSATW